MIASVIRLISKYTRIYRKYRHYTNIYVHYTNQYVQIQFNTCIYEPEAARRIDLFPRKRFPEDVFREDLISFSHMQHWSTREWASMQRLYGSRDRKDLLLQRAQHDALQ